MSTNERAKISFRLERDSDGYPPADWEHVWAKHAGDDLYEIDNIPFFAKSIALGDRVRARQVGSELTFMELVEPSGHSTLRVLMQDPSVTQGIRDELRGLGCESELSHIQGLISVDVPPNVEYSIVRALLDRREKTGVLEYEEAALGQDG
ncbi:MAG: DUF4265 domain-containing protein [Steroidobacteraceae bacterium]